MEVDKVQHSLLQGYQYDIAHYATAQEKVKAEKCYLTLGRQLLDKENHKFQYKEIEKSARAQKYYSSIDWLLRADMIHLCNNVSAIKYDLSDYVQDDFFRAYTTDLSLLMAMKDFSLKQHIVENTMTVYTSKGIYECAVADALYKKGIPLYFYKNNSKQTIDFLIQLDGKVIPIEVKGSNSKPKSLNTLIENNSEIDISYKLIDRNICTNEKGNITLPLYMVSFL